MRKKYEAPKVMPLGASSAQGQTGLSDVGASAVGVCVGGRSPGICSDGSFVFGYCFVGSDGQTVGTVCSTGPNYFTGTNL
jgi:hypothetical protein